MLRAPSYVQTPAFQPRPLADGGVFEDARVMWDFIGIGWKGTRDRRVVPKKCGMECGMAQAGEKILIY